MTDEELKDIARTMFRLLVSRLEGPPTEVQSWIDLAKSLGIKVRGFYGQPGEKIAWYDMSEFAAKGKSVGPFPQPVLYYNLRASEEDRICMIGHECGHHVGAWWPRSAFPRSGQERFNDVRSTVQHRACSFFDGMIREAFFCPPQANNSVSKEEA